MICKFIQINTVYLMGLCSIFAMLDKKAVHGNNNLIVSFFEEKEKSEADV